MRVFRASRVTVASRAATILTLVAAALGSGCISDKPKPTPLEAFQPGPEQVRAHWALNLDRKVEFPLSAGVHGTTLALASSDGTVMHLDAVTGKERWRAQLGQPILAGAGNDGTRVAVVTRDNELVVLADGKPTWRKPLAVKVSTAPLVAGERVFVLAVDRRVMAFDAIDGNSLWILQRPGDALGLVHAGVLAPYKNSLLVGQGPRLAVVDSLRGSVQFEVPLASPRGTNEIERLADLVGPISRQGDTVCVRAYQAAIGCVNVDRGTAAWTKTIGGIDAVGADASLVAGADASGRVSAWKPANGDVVWTHERLLHRGLGGAVVLPKAVAIGDAQGFLHFFDRATGTTLQRIDTGGGPIVGTPIVVGNTLVVVHRSGAVRGFALD
jgi:outer membrane protein assembly factor BamB